MRNTLRNKKTDSPKFEVIYPKNNQKKNYFTPHIKKIDKFNPITTRKSINEINRAKINDKIIKAKILETKSTKLKKYQKISKINTENNDNETKSSPQTHRIIKKIKQKEICQTTHNNIDVNTLFKLRKSKIDNNIKNRYKTLETYDNIKNVKFSNNNNCNISKLVISSNKSNYFHKKPLIEKYLKINSKKKEKNNKNIYSKPIMKSEIRENKFRHSSRNSNSIPNRSFLYLVHQASKNKELSNSFNKYYEKGLKNKLTDNYLNNTTRHKSKENENCFTKEEIDTLKKLRSNSKRQYYQMLNMTKYNLSTVNNPNNFLEDLRISNSNFHNGCNNTFYSGFSTVRNQANSNTNYNTNVNTAQNNETLKKSSVTLNSNINNNDTYERKLVRPRFNSPDYNDDNVNCSPNKNLYQTFIEFENINTENLNKNGYCNIKNINLENLLIIENFYRQITDKLLIEEKCLKEICELINFNLTKKYYYEEINIFQQKKNIRTVIYYIKTEILCQFILYDICSSKHFDQSLIILKNIFDDLHKNFIILISLIIRKYKTSGGEMFHNLRNIVKKYYYEKKSKVITEINEGKLLHIMYDSLKNIYTCYKMLIENIYKKFYYDEDLDNKAIKFPYCLKNKNNSRKETLIIKSHFFIDAYENINDFKFTDLKDFFYLYLYCNSIRNVFEINVINNGNFNTNNNIINNNIINNNIIDYTNIENNNNFVKKHSLSNTVSSINLKSRQGTINIIEKNNNETNSKENDNINVTISQNMNNLHKSSTSPIKYIPIHKFKIKNIQVNSPISSNILSKNLIFNSLVSPIYTKKKEEIKNIIYKHDASILNKIEKIINNNPNISHRLPPIKDYYEYSLILDLDSTLVYLSKGLIRENNNYIEKKTLILRPGLIEFLHDMKSIYELILFSSGVDSYVDPLVNVIEKNEKFFEYVLYKKHITKDEYGNYVKNIRLLGRDMKKMIVIDDSPQYLKLNKKNSICIKPFYGDTVEDRNTLKILGNVLKKIRFDADDTKDITESLRVYKKDLYPDVIEELDE